MSKIIQLSPIEAGLKRSIRKHLKSVGFVKDRKGNLVPPDLTKETYRAMHLQHKLQKLEKNRAFLKKHGKKLLKHFASGKEVKPKKIKPRLELVPSDSWQSDLFRMATLFWQVPVSEGYGRRMRFLVWDDYNDKLIGIFALGDAVFNLRVRDELIGWNHKQRAKKLVNIMDAYALGAVPPYNQLLGGKLIACLVKSKEVQKSFKQRYWDATGIISGKAKHPELTVITTTSALGRSSIYNRLTLNTEKFFKPIGYTSGFGHFHIPDALFEQMREYLRQKGDKYAQNFKFGQGPNWRLRTIRKVLNMLDMPDSLINHGLPREVFMTTLADNAFKVLCGKEKRPDYTHLHSVQTISELARSRWMEPRAQRFPEYVNWRRKHFWEAITGGQAEPAAKELSNHALRSR